MKILVTGTAGFIGFHLAKHLLDRGDVVVGLDNINDYYDVALKYARLLECGIPQEDIGYNRYVQSTIYDGYTFARLDLEDQKNLLKLFQTTRFDAVCHLAAQAGVRYSLTHPEVYVQSNIVGFLNILEACRKINIKNLCYASSSSVYGLNNHQPFATHHNVDHPISLYAASKKSNELMAHTYSYLFKIPATGLRFFTVYGPWGRPDMALFKFVKNILENRPIDVYNFGKMRRDFTYIDDIIEGVIRVIDNPATPSSKWSGQNPDASSSSAPYRIYNIGNGRPVPLGDFISAIEDILGRKAKKNLLPLQPGDIPETFADTSDLEKDLNYRPSMDIQEGIALFVDWYRNYYQV